MTYDEWETYRARLDDYLRDVEYDKAQRNHYENHTIPYDQFPDECQFCQAELEQEQLEREEEENADNHDN